MDIITLINVLVSLSREKYAAEQIGKMITNLVFKLQEKILYLEGEVSSLLNQLDLAAKPTEDTVENLKDQVQWHREIIDRLKEEAESFDDFKFDVGIIVNDGLLEEDTPGYGCGYRKIPFIQAIRAPRRHGLKEARELVESICYDVHKRRGEKLFAMYDLSFSDAAKFYKEAKERGLTPFMQPSE